MFKSYSSLVVLSALVVAQGAYAKDSLADRARNVKDKSVETGCTVCKAVNETAQSKTTRTVGAGVVLGHYATRGIDKLMNTTSATFGSAKTCTVDSTKASASWLAGHAQTAGTAVLDYSKENPGKVTGGIVVTAASLYALYSYLYGSNK